MLFELKLARAFLFTRRRSLARFTAAVAVITLAAGVAAVIVAQAIGSGFRTEMQAKILANTAHVAVFMKDGSRIENWQADTAGVKTLSNVSAILPGAYESAMLMGQNSTEYVVLKADDSVPSGGQDIVVSVGNELAEKSGTRVGDRVRLLLVGDDGTTRDESVTVGGTFRTGLFEYDSTWIKVSRADVARLRGEESFTPSLLDISLNDIFRSDETANQIRNLLGERFRVIDWQEANRPLFAALSTERRAAIAVIALIVLVAALNITTTLALIVNERRADIAVLKTCGTTRRRIVTVFFAQGIALAATGISAGVLVGVVASSAGNYFEILKLPADVYSLGYIPLRVEPSSILVTIAAALAIGASAAIYPAIRASRMKPLELFRTQ